MSTHNLCFVENWRKISFSYHQIPSLSVLLSIYYEYRNFPKFSDGQVWVNSADPDQTVCNSLCIFWMNYSKETPSCSTFRVITTNSLGVRIFRKFTVFLYGWMFLYRSRRTYCFYGPIYSAFLVLSLGCWAVYTDYLGVKDTSCINYFVVN